MEFSVKIEGLDKLAAKSQLLAKIAAEEVSKALYVSGKHVEKEAKQSILEGNKSGRTYKRGNVVHRASAPGEAPASDTGRLVNSINTEVSGLEATVKAGGGIVTYAKHLEHGTRHIAARPFMFPALEKSKAFIRTRFEQALSKTIDRAASAAMKAIGK
jgi:HK97 gp10 family phage protein